VNGGRHGGAKGGSSRRMEGVSKKLTVKNKIGGTKETHCVEWDV